MCATLYFYFCIPCSVLTTKNLVSICGHTVNPLPVSPSPSDNHYFVLCIYVFVFIQFGCLFFVFVYLFFVFIFCIPHMSKVILDFEGIMLSEINQRKTYTQVFSAESVIWSVLHVSHREVAVSRFNLMDRRFNYTC